MFFFLFPFEIYSAAKILPKRSTEPGGVSFKNSCQKAADALSLTIDGKQKEFDESTTYANIKTLLKNIQKSAYFEKLNQTQQSTETTELRTYYSSFHISNHGIELYRLFFLIVVHFFDKISKSKFCFIFFQLVQLMRMLPNKLAMRM